MKYPDHPNNVDIKKRRTLKFIGGSAVLAGTATSAIISPAISAAELTNSPVRSGVEHNTGQVSINIMISKSVDYDWILMENLTDNAIEIKKFNPGIIVYLGKQLDLNQLLSGNSTNGSMILHSDTAWSESLYNFSAMPFFAPGNQQLQADAALEAVSADTKMIRCRANVVGAEAEVFIGNPPGIFT